MSINTRSISSNPQIRQNQSTPAARGTTPNETAKTETSKSATVSDQYRPQSVASDAAKTIGADSGIGGFIQANLNTPLLAPGWMSPEGRKDPLMRKEYRNGPPLRPTPAWASSDYKPV